MFKALFARLAGSMLPVELVLMVIVIMAAGAWHAHDKHKALKDQETAIRAEYTKAALRQVEANIDKQTAAANQVTTLQKALQNAKKTQSDQAAALDAELGRLRDQLAARGGQGPGDASAAPRADGNGGPERELLGSCATALVGLAKEADRLEGKVVALQGYALACHQITQPGTNSGTNQGIEGEP